MYHQLLTPVAGSLPFSVFVAALPIVTVLVALGILRRPAWQASLAGVLVGLTIATLIWRMPPWLALNSLAAGSVFALWPVMWIVMNGLLLYNIALTSGRFGAFRDWLLDNLPNDRRIVVVIIGFCFGCLLEGVAGFGAPVAITTALLVLIGLPPFEALTVTLICNTAPVAFGALGIPVTVLAQVTGLPAVKLGAMIGRQLPLIGLILPCYVTGIYGGLRSIRALWPVLLVAGGSFGLAQFVTSNYIDYSLTDVLSALVSLGATFAFLRFWAPVADPEFEIHRPAARPASASANIPTWQGWLPWIIVAAIVIVWTRLKIATIGQQTVAWPGLHNEVFITLYDKPYAANWVFQPLATGTAVLLASFVTAALVGVGPRRFGRAVVTTCRQSRMALLTVALIVGLAYLMNYSGMSYTLGLGVASVGRYFLSAFISVSGLDRRISQRQRYFRKRAIRQFASRRRTSAGLESDPHCRDQFIWRRNGKNDLAAEYRRRNIGYRVARPGRSYRGSDVQAQHHFDVADRRVGGPATIRAELDVSVTTSGTLAFPWQSSHGPR